MADQRKVTLYQGHATPKTIILRALPVADVSVTEICMHTLHATPTTIIMRPVPCVPVAAPPVADENTPVIAYQGDTERPELETVDLTVFDVILTSPLEDTAAVADEDFIQPVSFEDLVSAKEGEQEPGFWATAPPDQDDEWVGAVVHEAATADQEADYGFTVSPLDQDDEAAPQAYAGQDGTAEDAADYGDTFATAPLDDEPVVDTDYVPVAVFDPEDAGIEQADGFLGLGPLDELAAPPEEATRGKGGWDPYYYKRRKKRKKDKAELETYLAETAGPVPEPIRDEVADARAAAIRALESDEPTFLGEAIKAINRADAAARLAAKQAALADEEEDEELLLLWS